MASPYSQYPQSSPFGPGPLAPPVPPPATIRAWRLILAGSVLAIVYGVVDGLTLHNSEFISYSSTQSGTTVHHLDFLIGGIVGGVIDCLVWLWMAWKTKAGRNWARVLSTVFFGFSCLSLLSSLGSVERGGGVLFEFALVLANWGVGVAAIVQLWRPESSQFFTAAKQAKLATQFATPYPGAPYPGSQPPGYPASPYYGQPPQYSQTPDHGQSPHHGQSADHGQSPHHGQSADHGQSPHHGQSPDQGQPPHHG